MEIGVVSEVAEASEAKTDINQYFSKESLQKYDHLFEDDKLPNVEENAGIEHILKTDEVEKAFDKLFEKGDFFVKQDNLIESGKEVGIDMPDPENNDIADGLQDGNNTVEAKESDEELNKKLYETDENGHIYKENGELLPNVEYSANGNEYRTDENGNIVEVKSNPKYTDEGVRNLKEQKESGGEERQEKDDGGHLVARMLVGTEGIENLVPMRRTINRGDYKRMENEISKALQDGKEVKLHLSLEYEGDSKRPSKIKAEYYIDGKRTEIEFDNVENSTDLMEELPNRICDEDFDRIKQRISDMKEDGCEASITSVKTEYDEEGKPIRVTIGILDESTGEKTYKVCDPR